MGATTTNADAVMAIYECFGRGDVPGILEHIDPDVEWDRWDEGNSLQEAGFPLMQHRKGHDGVTAFLAAIPQTLDIQVFELRSVMSDGDTVAARLRVRAVHLGTGRTVEDDEWHIWTFGPDGRVVEFRHLLDTGKQLAAWRD